MAHCKKGLQARKQRHELEALCDAYKSLLVSLLRGEISTWNDCIATIIYMVQLDSMYVQHDLKSIAAFHEISYVISVRERKYPFIVCPQ